MGRGKNEIPEWVFLSPGQIVWEDSKLVGREEGKRVEMHNVKNRVFHKCVTKARLRRIRFHDLRHTLATLLLMQGESPVSELRALRPTKSDNILTEEGRAAQNPY